MRNAIRLSTRFATPLALPARTILMRLIACLCLMAALPAWADVDLVPTAVSTTATSLPVNGMAIISTTVKNQGTTPTTNNSTVGIYLSTDATITTADTLIGSRAVYLLAAGASSTGDTTVTIPAGLAPGTYYIGAYADISAVQPETNETNNGVAGAAIAVVRDVDLVPTAVSTTATSLPVNGMAIISTTVKNQGTTPTTNNSTVGIYLSTDTTITTADTQIGARAAYSLAAGASSTGDTTVTIPAGLAPGTYYIGAYADKNAVQPETDETNNASAGVAIAVVRDVDLVITAVSTTATSLPVNGTAVISTTAKNQGTTPTTYDSTVGIYLSMDATITTADTQIGARAAYSLAAGASSTGDTTVTIPAGLAPGTYYIGAYADKNAIQPETNEANNGLTGTTLVVAAAPNAPVIGAAIGGNAQATVSFTAPANNGGSAITGYTVTSTPGNFTATGTASPLTVSGLTNGTAYTFTVKATNAVGTSVASAASNSVTPTATATIPGAPTIGAATGGNAQATVAFTAPANNGGSTITGYTVTSTPGNFTATGTASPIAITGLTNGTAYTFTVTATNAKGTGASSAVSNSVTPFANIDLAITSLTTTNTTIVQGTTFPVSDTTNNQGASPTTASSITIGYYLSTDNNITAADTLIGSRTTNTPLAGGAGSSATTNVYVPSNLAAGTYYLGAIADIDNSQTETNESNNALAGAAISVTTSSAAAGQVTPVVGGTATRTSAFAYDAATGLLTKEIIEPDTSALCLVTEYTLDAYGNKTAATTRNCNGSAGEAAAPGGDPVITTRSTSNTLDSRGQFPLTSSNALNQSETKTFDPRFGAALTLTGPNGLTTTWTYDNFGRKTRETRADGTGTKWDYLYCAGYNGGSANCPTIGGAAGVYLIQTTPLASDGTTQNGPISKAYFDALNRQIRSETQGYDGTGTATAIYKDTQYDSLGRPYMTSRPYYAGQTAYWTTATYDALGRVISETQPDGTVTSTAYNGLTVTVTNANSQTRTTVKNSQGQIVSVTDAQSKTLTYSYDPFGNLTKTQDALGNVTALGYDLRGRKTGMADPDMGTWTYAYNALGQLVRQTDAKGQTSTIAYDKLGRMTNRAEADLISNWYYDTYKGGGACNKGTGKLCQSETSTGYNRTITYDNLGRDSSTVTTLDTTYNTSVTYDANGRLLTQSYPSGLVAKYVYTPLGYLKEIRNNANNALYWQANSLDAEGHLLQQTYGNAVVTQQTWNASNGRLSSIVAGAGNAVQNLTYQYDNLGNITSRNDANQSLSETFLYDSLNRLTSATVNSGGAGIVTITFAFDAIGNIVSRSDLTPVNGYTYNPSGIGSIRPHALTQLTLSTGGKRTYQYDANGSLTTETQYDAANNIIANKGRAEYYTSFNMPNAMGSPGLSLAFYYGPEHQRIKQISSSQGTTYYLNPGNNGDLLYEKDIKPDNSTEQRNYITAYGQVVAMVKLTNGATWTTRYLHRDNLGSVTAITDEAGVVIERLAYEPFGKRRFTNGATDPNNTILPQNTDRGFTNHEHLDELTLIHMNGRVYDPVAGRFMSADPYIQDPLNLQSYNRYAYVMNNPLLYTDPSGYFSFKKFFRAAAAIVVAVYAPQFIATATGWGATASQVAAGALSGGISSGNLQGVVTGGISAGLFSGLHGMDAGFGKVLAHGMAGGVMSEMSGGSFRSGFLSAAFTQTASQMGAFNNLGDPNTTSGRFQNAMAAAAVGGTASVMGGGKFANGAMTGAFSRLFNDLKCGTDKCYADKPTKSEIDEHWRNGGGKPVYVNGENVDLSYIPTENFPEVGSKGSIGSKLGVALGIGDGRIYGSLTATRINTLQVTLLPDSYDFQPHAGPGTTIRNVETYFGFYSASKVGTQVGTDFKIHFVGPTPVP